MIRGSGALGGRLERGGQGLSYIGLGMERWVDDGMRDGKNEQTKGMKTGRVERRKSGSNSLSWACHPVCGY